MDGAEVTLRDYTSRWLAQPRKATTRRRYQQIVDTYIVPQLGTVPVASLDRARCRELLVGVCARRAPATARAVLAVLQAVLADAHSDGILPHNPANGLRKGLGLRPNARDEAEGIRALTAPELSRFLAGAWASYPQLAPVFETCARAALRLGEALALRWSDRRPGELRIAWSYTDKQLLRPKGGRRTVEIGPDLDAVLERLPARMVWMFPSSRPGGKLPLWDATWVARVARHVGRQTGLPFAHCHMLRHSAASLWLAQGEPVSWVSRQLGHASTAFTERVYARWIRAHNPNGLRRFDALLRGERDSFPLLPGKRVDPR